MTFDYIVPDILVSGGELPIKAGMKALANGFFDFYSSPGWKAFIFSIFPICALLGLMGLSHKLSTGEETWGKGCSNFIFKVMIATAILVVAPNSPKYLTELINQTSEVLRISNNIDGPNDLFSDPYVSRDLNAIINKNNKAVMSYVEYMNPIITEYSYSNPDVYGANVTFATVTGLGDPDNDGTGFPNVNFHDPTNDAGEVIPSSSMNLNFAKAQDVSTGDEYNVLLSPLSKAVDEAFSRLKLKSQNLIDNSDSMGIAKSKMKSEVIPRFGIELNVIRSSFISHYLDYMSLEQKMKYYSKIDENSSEKDKKKQQIKLDAVHAELYDTFYEDLSNIEKTLEENEQLSGVSGIFFDFSMIFVSIYVTFNLYILPIVLPLWAAMSMLPDSSQLSQSLKKGLTIVITTWLLPVFLDLIILVGNSLINLWEYMANNKFGGVRYRDGTAEADEVFSLKNAFSYVGDPGSLAVSLMDGGVVTTTLIPLMGGFVAMMLIIASPLIVNKLISGSSGFIDTITSAGQKGAGLAATAVTGGVAAGAALAVPVTGGASLAVAGAATAAKGAASAVGGAAKGFASSVGKGMADNTGPMDSA